MISARPICLSSLSVLPPEASATQCGVPGGHPYDPSVVADGVEDISVAIVGGQQACKTAIAEHLGAACAVAIDLEGEKTMAFRAVDVSKRIWRVWDEERDIEFKRVSGSSNGTLYFLLTSSVDEKRISAKRTFGSTESEDADEVLLRWHLPMVASDATFRYGPSADDVVPLRQVLTEAFEEYHSSGHPLEGYIVKVEFGKDYNAS